MDVVLGATVIDDDGRIIEAKIFQLILEIDNQWDPIDQALIEAGKNFGQFTEEQLKGLVRCVCSIRFAQHGWLVHL